MVSIIISWEWENFSWSSLWFLSPYFNNTQKIPHFASLEWNKRYFQAPSGIYSLFYSLRKYQKNRRAISGRNRGTRIILECAAQVSSSWSSSVGGISDLITFWLMFSKSLQLHGISDYYDLIETALRSTVFWMTWQLLSVWKHLCSECHRLRLFLKMKKIKSSGNHFSNFLWKEVHTTIWAMKAWNFYCEISCLWDTYFVAKRFL